MPPLPFPIHIRTGGQTGVDRAALDFAKKKGLPYGGWCPAHRTGEDKDELHDLLVPYPHLRPTPSTDNAQRTAWNVRDSHATLILVPEDFEVSTSPGTKFTQDCAELVFLRPCMVVDVTDEGSVADVRGWLEHVVLTLGITKELWLNVAGPRESEMVGGVYKEALAFLAAVVW